ASYAQERVWVDNQLDPDSPVYNISACWVFPDGLGRDQVTEVFAKVVARHEALRTALRMEDGRLVQVVREAQPLRLPETDLSAVRQAEQRDQIARIGEQLARTAIPLAQPPLWRARLLRLADRSWALVLVFHHAVFDSHSLVVLGRELTALGAAAVDGSTAALPELPIQYADYAAWQRDQLAGDELDRQLAYWRERLAGAPALLPLPLDRPRPDRPGFAGDEVHFALPDGLLDQVGRVAAGTGATPYMVLTAGYLALLTRVCGVEDLVLGVSTAGRELPELAPLIGMFVNPVALRCDTGGDPTFAGLVARVREALVGALDHGQTPFQRIVEAAGARPAAGVQPVFQTAFNFIPETGIDPVPLGTTKDDLAFDIATTTSRVLYRTALFDRATAQAFADRYVRLLCAAVAQPQRRISTLPLLADGERERVLALGDGTGDPVESLTLPALLERQAAAAPEAAALVCDGVVLRYAELNARANRLARVLVAGGARPEARVAVALPRSPRLVVAVLAVLKAGAAFVPVDPGYPAGRRGYLVEECAPVLVLDEQSIVDAEAAAADLADQDLTDADRRAPLRPGHPAYVIYTSGSTGRPKGVVVEHRAVSAYLAWARKAYPGLSGTALLHSPLWFDLSITALFGTLTAGGTLHLAGLDEPAARAGGRPDFVKLTPSHLPLLTADVSPGTDLVVGGEALSSEQLAAWRAANPAAAVCNEYGPTEATVGCVVARIAPGQPLPAGPVPIGRPAPGVRVYLLDANLQPVPAGVPGELYVAGGQLARGYLNRPALTAERFLPCPYGPPGGRMYRTGDLARWRRDGGLDYLGRLDRQVKVAGYRIEPGEIESALLALPEVREAAVVVRTEGGVPALVGYVTGPADPAALPAKLSTTLPGYLVPSAFVVLDRLPLTGNGKLDQAALPPPETAAPATGYRAPGTDAEVLVADVFARILQLPRVGAGDDFFALGGNSLRGMRAMAQIRAEVAVDVPVRTLFSHPVVADLAAQIEQLIAAEVDGLSDDEVAAQLAATGEQPS
ncbi:MAG: amino acid adenylation domain-containing protein, partial [Micromonosporaceae bacterium]|nr:amino acid adenylation domain-containing protein [Micromonosporaceae bacterium]